MLVYIPYNLSELKSFIAFRMKKVLITGAAGFIGFHLALLLKKRGGADIIGLDNFNTYYDQNLKRAREKILKENGIAITAGDICDGPLLEKLLEENKITHLVHLAAQAGVRHSFTHPHEYVKSNLEGFTSILEACRKNIGMKLVYASSSSVYGLNKATPFSEDDKTDQPANLYGATKKANELMAASYQHLYGINSVGLRYFTVYGPWGRPDMAYFHFTDNIVKNKPLLVFNHGKMKRDFTYIDDIVEGTAAALDLDAKCEIINLGNHNPVPVLRLIELIEQGLGKKAIKQMLPKSLGEAIETYADIEKAKKLLNFVPKVSLEEGMERFLSWYKDYHSRH